MKNITLVFRLAPTDASEARAKNDVKVKPVVTMNPGAISECGILERTVDVEEFEWGFFFGLPNAINLNEGDLSHISDQRIKKNLKKMLYTYKPQKSKTTDVTMKLI
ncbi:hypothetical protein NPIL_100901 [Nephila pilipes]|uniref:Uncharacterized protein n=1 Tax=Nephila pilipes TaxID=299642 RepID=A0A8X6TEE1_NEPPI|nr:hypothetical protein NPIL_100901 [Nephila pilipes]